MTKADVGRDRATRWMRWIARIWSLPIIVAALLVVIGYGWDWATAGAADPYAVEEIAPVEFLPPVLLFLGVVGLGIAWRWEGLGGTIAMVFQLAALASLLIQTPIAADFPRSAIPYLLLVVTAVPGVLFLLCWRRSR